tara:strand:+ start:15803 stop:16702 length:900 start_codon:yes stop_codon:yes gene_type:complete
MLSGASPAFVLGTVQIGMTYGATNAHDAPADGHEVLAAAARAGVQTLDTAQAYGRSEEIIGQVLRENPDWQFSIISKISPDVDHRDRGAVLAACQESVRQLGQPLYGCMYHDPAVVYDWNDGAGAGLRDARDAGLTQRIGVSVYTQDQFRQALESDGIDIIQAPFNLLDRGLETSGLMDKAIAAGCEVHVRSVFLQGLLLADPLKTPERLAFMQPWLQGVRDICQLNGVNPLTASVGYVRQCFPDVRLVIGCDDGMQLQRNLALFEDEALPDKFISMIRNLETPPDIVVNPALWPRAAT